MPTVEISRIREHCSQYFYSIASVIGGRPVSRWRSLQCSPSSLGFGEPLHSGKGGEGKEGSGRGMKAMGGEEMEWQRKEGNVRGEKGKV